MIFVFQFNKALNALVCCSICVFLYFFFMLSNLISFSSLMGELAFSGLPPVTENTSVYSKIAKADCIITSDCIRYSSFNTDMISMLCNYCLTYNSMEDSDRSCVAPATCQHQPKSQSLYPPTTEAQPDAVS